MSASRAYKLDRQFGCPAIAQELSRSSAVSLGSMVVDQHRVIRRIRYSERSRVMNSIERHAHWQTVYQTKGEHDVSWFEESPAISLELIRATAVSTTASIIDIGGGTSRLVDALLDDKRVHRAAHTIEPFPTHSVIFHWPLHP